MLAEDEGVASALQETLQKTGAEPQSEEEAAGGWEQLTLLHVLLCQPTLQRMGSRLQRRVRVQHVLALLCGFLHSLSVRVGKETRHEFEHSGKLGFVLRGNGYGSRRECGATRGPELSRKDENEGVEVGCLDPGETLHLEEIGERQLVQKEEDLIRGVRKRRAAKTLGNGLAMRERSDHPPRSSSWRSASRDASHPPAA